MGSGLLFLENGNIIGTMIHFKTRRNAFDWSSALKAVRKDQGVKISF